MKTYHSSILAVLVSVAVFNTPAVQAKAPSHTAPESKSIPFSELGAKATADYKGDAIGITTTADGARLHTGFQKLSGTVSCEGLRLDSTESEGGGLTLTATAIGRSGPSTINPQPSTPLPTTGTVSIHENLVRWTRPGLVEEYSVSADGLRQDFMVPTAPSGSGELSVELT